MTGYDRVKSGKIITVRFAGLKSFEAGITDYVKIGVSLTYFNYGGTKGYVYEPTGKIVGPVTSVNVPIGITVDISETSTNFVG